MLMTSKHTHHIVLVQRGELLSDVAGRPFLRRRGKAEPLAGRMDTCIHDANFVSARWAMFILQVRDLDVPIAFNQPSVSSFYLVARLGACPSRGT